MLFIYTHVLLICIYLLQNSSGKNIHTVNRKVLMQCCERNSDLLQNGSFTPSGPNQQWGCSRTPFCHLGSHQGHRAYTPVSAGSSCRNILFVYQSKKNTNCIAGCAKASEVMATFIGRTHARTEM